ncbi:MAG: hypothetical protein H0X02_13710, partial [Nitrosomonas sp.]|nr:hypothetical protein [Nitrosomonas sp.]
MKQQFSSKNAGQKKFICSTQSSAGGSQLNCTEVKAAHNEQPNFATVPVQKGRPCDRQRRKCRTAGTRSKALPMLTSDSVYTDGDWKVETLVTTGEWSDRTNDFTYNTQNFGIEALAKIDGLGAVKLNDCTVRLYANYELDAGVGYEYTLKNGLKLRGSRVHYYDLTKECIKVQQGRLAYHTIIDRDGLEVTNVAQLYKGKEESILQLAQFFPPAVGTFLIGGISGLCSANFVNKGEFGFADSVFLTAEEGTQGSAWALDPCSEILYKAPMLGQMRMEQAMP